MEKPSTVTFCVPLVHTTCDRRYPPLLFGTNQSWNIASSREVTVRLSNRIVLTPYAAKRLSTLLAARVADYEQRFGKMSLEG